MTAACILRLGFLTVTFTGVMFALGLFLMIPLAAYMRDFNRDIGKKRLNAFFVFAIPAALVVGRAAYCLCGPERFNGRFWAIFALHAGGYSFMAVLAGFVLAALTYAHVYDIQPGQMLDVLCPGLIVLIMLVRFSETAPAQSTGHIITLRFLQNGLFSAADRYGKLRFAVSRLEAFAALAVFLACAVRLGHTIKNRTPDESGEMFCFAAVALSALFMPIEALRDGVFPGVFRIPLDMIVCAAALMALTFVSAVRLWKTDARGQFVLLRAVPSAFLTLLALALSRRTGTMNSPELNGLWILLCAAVAAALINSLRTAFLRRVRAEKAAKNAFIVRIPSNGFIPGGIAEEVPAQSATDFSARLSVETAKNTTKTTDHAQGGHAQ